MDLISAIETLSPAEQIIAMAEMFRGSLYATGKYLLRYQNLTKHTHTQTIKCLEAPSKRKLIVLPRGTFKSSMGSVAYPIWRLIKDPNERIMLDSEIYSNSKNFLREIKSHLESARARLFYGEFKDPNLWNEGEILIRQRTKIYKEASITASGIGAEKTGQHYSTIICDDLNSPTNSATKEGRDKVIQHYRYLTSILEPDGTLIVIGTRYADLDIPGFILRNEIENEAEVNPMNQEQVSRGPKPVYLLIGTPGSGKTWVGKQLADKFTFIPHDNCIEVEHAPRSAGLYRRTPNDEYLASIEKQARISTKPVLAETPFSISQIKNPLEARGIRVLPVFIIESTEVTTQRYQSREHKLIPQGHLTRIDTYRQRAREMKAPQGTSEEMLNYLRGI